MALKRVEYVPRQDVRTRLRIANRDQADVSLRVRQRKRGWSRHARQHTAELRAAAAPDDRPAVFRYKTASGKRTVKSLFCMRPLVAAAALVGFGAGRHRVVAGPWPARRNPR